MSGSGRAAAASVTRRLPAVLRPSEGGLNPGLVAALIVPFICVIGAIIAGIVLALV